MISLLKKIFVDNWLRKMISFALAIIIWFVVDQSLTSKKTLSSVGIRIINLPEGKTVGGLQTSGLLNKRLGLKFAGKRSYIEDLNSNDVEILIDANLIDHEGVVTIDKKHLVSLNPKFSVSHHVNSVYPKSLHVNILPLSKAKIPIYITKPIGEPPKGFQYLDIWPYHLNLTVSGPAETITKLKNQGLKLTYNLNDISRKDLEQLGVDKTKSITSFYIPDSWKFVNLPTISDLPISIDDPDAKILRIDFIRSELLPIHVKVPVSLVYLSSNDLPNSHMNYNIAISKFITSRNGIKVIDKQLFTRGVSKLFIDVIRDSVYISLSPSKLDQGKNKLWSIQISHPRTLEDVYVNRMISEIRDKELETFTPRHREEHLRNRFRNYLNRFQLYNRDGKLLSFDIEYKNKELVLKDSEEEAQASHL